MYKYNTLIIEKNRYGVYENSVLSDTALRFKLYFKNKTFKNITITLN